MGCFSWMYADRGNKAPLNIDEEGYLLNPFGENYHETCYDGYGRFDGHDVFELIADWNVEFIPLLLAYEEKGLWECKINKENLQNFFEGRPITCPKRDIGIMMACYDSDNSKLFFPIKICSKDVDYDCAGPSESDPNQGFGE